MRKLLLRNLILLQQTLGEFELTLMIKKRTMKFLIKRIYSMPNQCLILVN